MRCKNCKAKLPKEAAFCPVCRTPVTKRRKWPFVLVGVLVLVAILAAVGVVVAAHILNTTSISLNLGDDKEDVEDVVLDGEYSSEIYYEPVSEEHIATKEGSNLQYLDNELIVYLAEGYDESDALAVVSDYDGEIVGHVEPTNSYEISFPDIYTYDELEQMIETLTEDEAVEEADQNLIFEWDYDEITSDPAWGDKDLWGLEAINAAEAWDLVEADGTISVGVIDSGFCVNHEDLTFDKVVNNKYAELHDSTDHGTHVCGIIAAAANDVGGVGVAYNTSIVAVSYLSGSSYSFEADLALLVEKGCRVINISAGASYLTYAATQGNESALADLAKEAASIEQTILRLDAKGYDFLICKAAGNYNGTRDENDLGSSSAFVDVSTDDAPYGCVPYTEDYREIWEKYVASDGSLEVKTGGEANYDIFGYISDETAASHILVVASAEESSDGSYIEAGYSSEGSRVDLSAPGSHIYSTIGVETKTYFFGLFSSTEFTYGYKDGTSMASPMAAGVAVLVYTANSDLTAAEVKEILIESAADESGVYTGKLLDAEAAVRMALDADADTSGGEADTAVDSDSDVALVLDVSGSMDGEPIEDLQTAALSFLDVVLENDGAQVSITSFSYEATTLAGLTTSAAALKTGVEGLTATDSTNIEDGLRNAAALLDESESETQCIVLMSDGEPNEGLVGDELIAYAESIRDPDDDGADEVIIYALGFNVGSDAQYLLESIASDYCYYSVDDDVDTLENFFSDIGYQIAGTKFFYVEVACPVDVTVTYDGETLSSADDDLQTRTSFGSLSFKEAEVDEEGEDGDSGGVDEVKVLRLMEGATYDIEIEGTDDGTMTYTVAFADDYGLYTDTRTFSDIDVEDGTIATSSVERADTTYLAVDVDGDGKIDALYGAGANEEGEMMDNSDVMFAFFVISGAVVVLFVLIGALLLLRALLRPTARAA